MRSGSFDAELKVLLKLGRHPRLVRFFGQCTDTDGNHLLMTEFAEHGSLSDAFPKLEGQMTHAHKLVVMQQTCQGMEHLAEMKLVHRDLAARNVLLFRFCAEDVRQTSVKVCDFGLTLPRNYNRSYAIGQAGEARPIRYLPPEALAFDRYSEKSDVWSFGVLLWEILTNCMIPYFEVEDMNLVAHVSGGGRLSRFHIHDGCPDDLWALMESCWDAQAAFRPTFSELSISLAALSLSLSGQAQKRGAQTAGPSAGSWCASWCWS